jgi:hypothetical protein
VVAVVLLAVVLTVDVETTVDVVEVDLTHIQDQDQLHFNQHPLVVDLDLAVVLLTTLLLTGVEELVVALANKGKMVLHL